MNQISDGRGGVIEDGTGKPILTPPPGAVVAAEALFVEVLGKEKARQDVLAG